jgi:ribosomal protein L12E/L44/L45/RPP1/RPP2
MLFRSLLETLGIETERIHFTWISAAEGKKFQHVIAEITEQARAMGPYAAYQGLCVGQASTPAAGLQTRPPEDAQ